SRSHAQSRDVSCRIFRHPRHRLCLVLLAVPVFSLLLRLPPRSTLFPYTTLFRSLERERVTRPVRLIGISAGRLGPAGVGQLGLFDPHAVRRERLARVIDRLTARFGEGAVIPATLLPRKGDIIPST